jgi:formylglycine-generating enzyme required for sulfatase activity
MTSGQTDHALPAAGPAKEMARIPGGTFLMGSTTTTQRRHQPIG